MSTEPTVDQVIAQLLEVSGCRDREDLLAFACTLYVSPGSTGCTSYEVAHALAEIEQGIIPDLLAPWHALIREERTAVMAAA
ncbi:MAG TPA: hypothetical protein VFL98_00405 [Candidatus Paceibacterota bacterium]|nr:hypothetical protein [Candidatus Paceibacterota bacterium]